MSERILRTLIVEFWKWAWNLSLRVEEWSSRTSRKRSAWLCHMVSKSIIDRDSEGGGRMIITEATLLAHGAEHNCDDMKLFVKVFPNGARWPEDMETASRAGISVEWAIEVLGLSGTYCGWYENGRLQWEYEYQDGKRHGIDCGWHENGQPAWKNEWQCGKPYGIDQAWHDNGKPWIEGERVNAAKEAGDE
jgi:hypothetical protein